jgi:hypothetical protein
MPRATLESSFAMSGRRLVDLVGRGQVWSGGDAPKSASIRLNGHLLAKALSRHPVVSIVFAILHATPRSSFEWFVLLRLPEQARAAR